MSTSPFAPVTDVELARARTDPAFRQQLLSQNLDVLLARLQSLRSSPQAPRNDKGVTQIREGVELAVKLAELIQAPATP